MSDNISPEIRERIEALLRDVAAGYDLDDDTREELRAHMMEKFQDYKIGVEPVSDEDAFVLVREHFGNPAVVRARFRENSRRVTPMQFFRWFSAAEIATVLAFIVTDLLTEGLERMYMPALDAVDLARVMRAPVADSVILPGIQILLHIAVLTGPVAGFLLLASLLRHWRKREDRGKLTWYNGLKPWMLALVLMVAFLVAPLIGSSLSTDTFRLLSSQWVVSITYLLLSVAYLAVYLKWFEHRPKYIVMPLGILSLFAFSNLVSIVKHFVYLPLFGFDDGTELALDAAGLRMYGIILLAALVIVIYPAIRKKVITTVKSVGAFND